MMMMRRSLMGALALAAMVLSGCVVEVTTWTPIGTDASAAGSWTLNGVAPTISACEAAGIADVEIQFSNRLDSPVIPAEFVFNCEDGGFNLANVLAAGNTFDAHYIIRTSGADIVSPVQSMTVVAGATVVFNSIDIVTSGPVFNPIGADFTMDGQWTINGGVADAASCGAAGIANVQLVIQQAGDEYTEPGFIFSCAGGGFDTRTLSPQIAFTWGSYMTFWRALDSTGVNLGMSSALPLVVNSPLTHSTLATADFVFGVPSTLTLNLTYDTVAGVGVSDSDCAGASVATIFYTLTDVTGGGSTVVSEGPVSGIACTNQIYFDETIVTGGHTYSVYLEGADAAGYKLWQAMDSTLSVAVDTAEYYDVALDKV